jgi:hypothetical protein
MAFKKTLDKTRQIVPGNNQKYGGKRFQQIN